jgi:predicted nucleotidyltransferase
LPDLIHDLSKPDSVGQQQISLATSNEGRGVTLEKCLPELSNRGLLPANYESIVVVGSRARGWANEGSDCDIYVITAEPWHGPRTMETRLHVTPETVPIAVEFVDERRWEIKYFLQSQIDQVLDKVTSEQSADGTTDSEVTLPEQLLLVRLAYAIAVAGEEKLAVCQRRIRESRFRSVLVSQALDLLDSCSEDAVGALGSGDRETAVVATKRAFIHAVQALLASHDEYESGKWRSRAMRLLDPEELPFDEYWAIETMRTFDPEAAHLWVEQVLTTCQRISAGIEIR